MFALSPNMCSTTHAMDVYAVLRALSVRGTYTRQHIMTDDGGTLGLDWWQGSDKPGAAPPTAPILLIIHGINGGWVGRLVQI
jgi:abhydrolase domain-containing protein 1/3